MSLHANLLNEIFIQINKIITDEEDVKASNILILINRIDKYKDFEFIDEIKKIGLINNFIKYLNNFSKIPNTPSFEFIKKNELIEKTNELIDYICNIEGLGEEFLKNKIWKSIINYGKYVEIIPKILFEIPEIRYEIITDRMIPEKILKDMKLSMYDYLQLSGINKLKIPLEDDDITFSKIGEKYTEKEIEEDIDKKPKNKREIDVIYSKKATNKQWKELIIDILKHGYEIIVINDHPIRFDIDWNAYESETYELIGPYMYYNNEIIIGKHQN